MFKTLAAASVATLLAAAACGEDADDGMTTTAPTASSTGPTVPATGTAPTAMPTTAPTPSSTAPTTTGPSYATDIEPFFVAKCAGGTCHGPDLLGGPGDAGSGAALDLTQGAGYAAMQQPSIQATIPMIGATAAGSYLWLKLDDMQSTAMPLAGASLGIKMPFFAIPGTDAVTQQELDLVKAWIEAGAAP